MFLWPLPTLALIAILIGIGVSWWVARSRVSKPAPPPVAMMIQRIAFEGGIRPSDPQTALVRLERPDEIVIPFEHAILVIDFPLTTPAHVPITSEFPVGFTRSALVRAICDEYGHIYDAEEGTAATKTVPPDERRPAERRNRTDGAYGIWGHDLEDLVVKSAHWTRELDGTVKIELHVEDQPPASGASR